MSKPPTRPVRQNAQQILDDTEREVQKIVDDVMPDLEKNWEKLSPGTRDALIRGFNDK